MIEIHSIVMMPGGVYGEVIGFGDSMDEFSVRTPNKKVFSYYPAQLKPFNILTTDFYNIVYEAEKCYPLPKWKENNYNKDAKKDVKEMAEAQQRAHIHAKMMSYEY